MIHVGLILGVGLAFAGLLVACGPEGSPRRRVKDGPFERLRRAMSYLEQLVGVTLLPVTRKAVADMRALADELERGRA